MNLINKESRKKKLKSSVRERENKREVKRVICPLKYNSNKLGNCKYFYLLFFTFLKVIQNGLLA